MPTPHTLRTRTALSACIRDCLQAADARGRWRPVKRCAADLAGLAGNASPSALDLACVQAARAVAEHLAGVLHAAGR
jgi:hypothetical protein